MPFEFWIGLRYFLARRKHSFISVITVVSIAGVVIGVTALIVVLAVMTGFDQELRRRILGANADIVVRNQAGIEEKRSALEQLLSVEGVEAAAPLVDGQVLFKTDIGIRGIVLRGIDAELEPSVTDVEDWIVQGALSFQTPDFPRTGDQEDTLKRGILIGEALAKRMDVALGEFVTLVSSEDRPEFGGFEPKMRVYRVTGLYSSGMHEFDMNVAYMDEEAAARLLNMEGTWPALHCRVSDSKWTDKVASRLREMLDFGYTVQSWKDLNKNFFLALELEKKAMAVILTLIILVASSNIACTLIMMVIEKTSDIGLLKSIGATNGQIVRIFVAQGLCVGIIGTLLGDLAGFGLCKFLDVYPIIQLPSDVYYMDTLAIQMRLWDFVWISCSAIGISLLATIYPAVRASKMDPVEALRDE